MFQVAGFTQIAYQFIEVFVVLGSFLQVLLFGFEFHAFAPEIEIALHAVVRLHELVQFLLAILESFEFFFDLLFFPLQIDQQLVDCFFVFAYTVFCVIEHFPSESTFFGNFKSIRTTRTTYFKLIRRGQVFLVKNHRAIEDTFTFVGKNLQVGVVGRDYTKRLAVIQFPQDGLGNRTPDLRIGTRAKFIDEYQRTLIGVFQKQAHVGQAGTIGTQVVFDGLLVADIGKEVVKNSQFRAFVHRYQQARLRHQLQQSGRFHGDRLSSGVRPTEYQNTVATIKAQVKRHRFFARSAVF